ncbi:MAG TPA: YciI family protein [Solirubrobacterales bacterium]|nr:YciI family protein [Gemmatimonadales bacterium]HSC20444.1 YciI family protein [Solirubrobacterales bacterium]
MQYIFLLYAQESGYGTLTEAEKAAWWTKINAYNDSLVKAGHYKMTSGLQSPSTAKTLTKVRGALETTDGPFAETKEQLLGFYIIEAKGMDEACALAARAPMAEFGKVEVRALNTRGE